MLIDLNQVMPSTFLEKSPSSHMYTCADVGQRFSQQEPHTSLKNVYHAGLHCSLSLCLAMVSVWAEQEMSENQRTHTCTTLLYSHAFPLNLSQRCANHPLQEKERMRRTCTTMYIRNGFFGANQSLILQVVVLSLHGC